MVSFELFIKRLYRRVKYFPIHIKEIATNPYESCRRCGTLYRLLWYVDSYYWEKVIRGDGCYCLDCFIKIAEIRNIRIPINKFELDLFYHD